MGSVTDEHNINGNKKHKRRIKHRIPGPAGEAQHYHVLDDDPSMMTVPANYNNSYNINSIQCNRNADRNNVNMDGENDVYGDHNDVNGNFVPSSSMSTSALSVSTQSGLPLLFQQSPAWTACCVSLERYVDYPLSHVQLQEQDLFPYPLLANISSLLDVVHDNVDGDGQSEKHSSTFNDSCSVIINGKDNDNQSNLLYTSIYKIK